MLFVYFYFIHLHSLVHCWCELILTHTISAHWLVSVTDDEVPDIEAGNANLFSLIPMH